MPRPKKPGAPEPKRRSRNGCWPCKSRKVKCDEAHPHCSNCQKSGTECDYTVRLNWLGDGNYRPAKKRGTEEAASFPSTPLVAQEASSPPLAGELMSPAQDHIRHPELVPAPGQKINPSPTLVTGTPALVSPTPVAFSLVDQQIRTALSESGSSAGLGTFPSASITEKPSNFNPLPQHRASLRPADSVEPYTAPGPSIATGGGTREEDGREVSPYDEDGVFDSPSCQLSPRKKLKHGFKAMNLDGAAQLSSWSPSSGSVESPRPTSRLHSSLSLTSEPSPLTSVSTPGGEDEYRNTVKPTFYLSSPPDIRRLSVQSLLAVPYETHSLSERSPAGSSRGYLHLLTRAITPETATFYGYDRGEPDKDLVENDDQNAILGYYPVDSTGKHGLPCEEPTRESHPSDFGFGMRETRKYYEKRVEVWISKEVEPLPTKLRQNPMNLLYFHHFLNHTARVLVPHDDPRSNPFRTVLPQMAVKHDNLLSLLLAYSASHRARHLRYPEPGLRIADLVQGVISDLGVLVEQAMHNPQTVISIADLATAIMLASLEIISPAAIGGSISWHHHLNLARELISRMPDGLQRIQPATQEDQIRAFLWSWFAYLDVLGSLSGGPTTLLTPSCYTTGGPPSPTDLEGRVDSESGYWDDDMERIDCILGFTPRCVFILARIAELARRCEEARLHQQQSWTPDPATCESAAALETAALRSLAAPSRPCGHVHAPSPLRRWDRAQMAATNRAFHHAALIHLHRRVLGKSSGHPDVRGAAQSILECLEHVERGSSAETCLLFPMFTAGCELVDPAERGQILERILGAERTGMTQVKRARQLMEKVWEKGQPWETLVGNEFIG